MFFGGYDEQSPSGACARSITLSTARLPMSRKICPVGLLVSLVLLGLVGCDAPVERFRPNALYAEVVSRREATSTEAAAADVAAVLEQLFGTPDEPLLPAEIPAELVSIDHLERASGPVWSDQAGVRFGLYRAQCVACHGVEGSGTGPAAAMQNPYPRDFRPAIFKFKSTSRGAKPTRADLAEVLHRGIPGTGMPSFTRLPAEDVEALVDYVIYLSIRGESERRLLDFAVRELGYGDDSQSPAERLTLDESTSPAIARAVHEMVATVVQEWLDAEQQVVPVPSAVTRSPDPAAIERGRELFHGPLANCASCHGQDGSGASVTLDFDDWTKEYSTRLGIAPDDREALEPLLDAGALRPRVVHPRTLKWGVFRGGGDAATLYRRFVVGIAGTPMPGLLMQETAGPTGVTAEQVSDLVAYVQSLADAVGHERREPVVAAERAASAKDQL